MTLQELIRAVREEVRDLGAQRWSDSTITRYLNDGLLELARVSHAMQVWEVNVSAGTVSVPLPADLLFLREAAWKTQSEKYGLDIRYGVPRTQPNETGFPQAIYVVDPATVVFDPTPDTSGVFVVGGIPRPARLVNLTDSPAFVDCDSALIAYACWRCLLSDGDPLAAQRREEWETLKSAWLVADAQRNPMQTVLERRPWWW